MAPDAPEEPAGDTANPPTKHASCVAIGDKGVLIRGPSGSGKSSLALRLILDAPRALEPAVLVADDRVVLAEEAEGLVARPAPLLAGLIEVRGLGIRRMPYRATATLACVVDLVGSEPGAVPPVRLPEPEALTVSIQGHSLRRISACDSATGALLLAALLASYDYEN